MKLRSEAPPLIETTLGFWIEWKNLNGLIFSWPHGVKLWATKKQIVLWLLQQWGGSRGLRPSLQRNPLVFSVVAADWSDGDVGR